LSRLCNDLRRSRQPRSTRLAQPALSIYSHYPVLVKSRNRLGLCRLRDQQSPAVEHCGPRSSTDEWWYSLRTSLFDLADYRSFCRPAAAFSFRGTVRASSRSGRVSARPAETASHTDVCFLTISDHGRIEARPNRQRASNPKGPAPSGIPTVACFVRAVFFSKETGNDQ
jgi:hypothetical protein